MIKRHDPLFRSWVADVYGEGILFADDHDNAIEGLIERCGQEPFLVYNRNKVIKNLTDDGMTESEAWEWIDFNWNAWLGPGTPAIVNRLVEDYN